MPPRGRKPALAVVEPRETMADAVEKTVEQLKPALAPEDHALAALAVEYARTIDRAAAIARDAARVPFDPDTSEAVEQLRKRVTAHATMADLGPKLLAALDALGATPKARAASAKNGLAKPGSGASSSPLAALRGGRATG